MLKRVLLAAFAMVIIVFPALSHAGIGTFMDRADPLKTTIVISDSLSAQEIAVSKGMSDIAGMALSYDNETITSEYAIVVGSAEQNAYSAGVEGPIQEIGNYIHLSGTPEENIGNLLGLLSHSLGLDGLNSSTKTEPASAPGIDFIPASDYDLSDDEIDQIIGIIQDSGGANEEQKEQIVRGLENVKVTNANARHIGLVSMIMIAVSSAMIVAALVIIALAMRKGKNRSLFSRCIIMLAAFALAFTIVGAGSSMALDTVTIDHESGVTEWVPRYDQSGRIIRYYEADEFSEEAWDRCGNTREFCGLYCIGDPDKGYSPNGPADLICSYKMDYDREAPATVDFVEYYWDFGICGEGETTNQYFDYDVIDDEGYFEVFTCIDICGNGVVDDYGYCSLYPTLDPEECNASGYEWHFPEVCDTGKAPQCNISEEWAYPVCNRIDLDCADDCMSRAVCGDGKVEGTEECDNGKHCGNGTSCTSHYQCDDACIPRNIYGCNEHCKYECMADPDDYLGVVYGSVEEGSGFEFKKERLETKYNAMVLPSHVNLKDIEDKNGIWGEFYTRYPLFQYGPEDVADIRLSTHNNDDWSWNKFMPKDYINDTGQLRKAPKVDEQLPVVWPIDVKLVNDDIDNCNSVHETNAVLCPLEWDPIKSIDVSGSFNTRTMSGKEKGGGIVNHLTSMGVGMLMTATAGDSKGNFGIRSKNAKVILDPDGGDCYPETEIKISFTNLNSRVFDTIAWANTFDLFDTVKIGEFDLMKSILDLSKKYDLRNSKYTTDLIIDLKTTPPKGKSNKVDFEVDITIIRRWKPFFSRKIRTDTHNEKIRFKASLGDSLVLLKKLINKDANKESAVNSVLDTPSPKEDEAVLDGYYYDQFIQNGDVKTYKRNGATIFQKRITQTTLEGRPAIKEERYYGLDPKNSGWGYTKISTVDSGAEYIKADVSKIAYREFYDKGWDPYFKIDLGKNKIANSLHAIYDPAELIVIDANYNGKVEVKLDTRELFPKMEYLGYFWTCCANSTRRLDSYLKKWSSDNQEGWLNWIQSGKTSLFLTRGENFTYEGYAYLVSHGREYDKDVIMHINLTEKPETFEVLPDSFLDYCEYSIEESAESLVGTEGANISVEGAILEVQNGSMNGSDIIRLSRLLLENCSCLNGEKDPNEDGIDCGGNCPDACQPSCSDGIKNQDETGIDCGGSCTLDWIEESEEECGIDNNRDCVTRSCEESCGDTVCQYPGEFYYGCEECQALIEYYNKTGEINMSKVFTFSLKNVIDTYLDGRSNITSAMAGIKYFINA